MDSEAHLPRQKFLEENKQWKTNKISREEKKKDQFHWGLSLNRSPHGLMTELNDFLCQSIFSIVPYLLRLWCRFFIPTVIEHFTHLFRPNFILISLEKICTTCKGRLKSLSELAWGAGGWSFCLYFVGGSGCRHSSFYSVFYLVDLSPGKSKGNKLFLWKIPLQNCYCFISVAQCHGCLLHLEMYNNNLLHYRIDLI